MSLKQIYLDYAATTPMAPETAKAMALCLTHEGYFANPASLQHSFGERAYNLIETSRIDIAHTLKCKANDLIFTSGATEANNLAIKGLALSPQNTRKHIITSATEHKAVIDTCKYLETQGFKVSYLKPENNGLINHDKLLAAITSETFLVSLMQVNNETGVIQDIEAIALALQDKDLHFHALKNFELFLDEAEALRLQATELKIYKLHGVKVHTDPLPKNLLALWVQAMNPKDASWRVGIEIDKIEGAATWIDPKIKKHTVKTRKIASNIASRIDNRIKYALNTMENAARGIFPCSHDKDLPRIDRSLLFNEVSDKILLRHKKYLIGQRNHDIRVKRKSKILV